ncbi:YqgQ family protein [Periweissella beninensis]|uniref:YqgQ family protein n=1 Tax=Periweissella beninensis TaxID=504936 RepID=UPI0021A65982|nr:YqgQ family protein [Periweissella beninensis]MCT4396637.1 DUF910 family protein [Periweissella beninensis]
MDKFYDVLQELKKYDIYIHLGKRLWDIELAALEIDNLYKAGLLTPQKYSKFKLILAHEHQLESKLIR